MTTRTSRKKPKKAELLAALNARGIHNPHNFCEAGGGRVYVGFRASNPRMRVWSAWQVNGLGFQTDPNAHWTDHGSKTFLILTGHRLDVLEQAKVWASKKYGITKWVRDPFGGWQDKRVYDKVVGNG